MSRGDRPHIPCRFRGQGPPPASPPTATQEGFPTIFWPLPTQSRHSVSEPCPLWVGWVEATASWAHSQPGPEVALRGTVLPQLQAGVGCKGPQREIPTPPGRRPLRAGPDGLGCALGLRPAGVVSTRQKAGPLKDQWRASDRRGGRGVNAGGGASALHPPTSRAESQWGRGRVLGICVSVSMCACV